MKKIIFTVALIVMASCIGAPTNSTADDVDSTEVDSTEIVDSLIVDSICFD